ncbi:hypothetical protein D3C84_1068430 [compost metagenome]
MRTEPAVLIAAASPWLNQAIRPALSELASASTAIRITATPARAGSELRSQRVMAAGLSAGGGKCTCRAPLGGCRWFGDRSLALYL